MQMVYMREKADELKNFEAPDADPSNYEGATKRTHTQKKKKNLRLRHSF